MYFSEHTKNKLRVEIAGLPAPVIRQPLADFNSPPATAVQMLKKHIIRGNERQKSNQLTFIM